MLFGGRFTGAGLGPPGTPGKLSAKNAFLTNELRIVQDSSLKPELNRV
jgi:hypothetical protein